MKKKKQLKILDIILTLAGGTGAVILAVAAIADHNATDMVSVIPSSLACCAMFVAGYISWRKNDFDK